MTEDVQTLADTPGPTPFGRATYFEQALFAASPFNVWITGLLVYAVLIGGYALAAGIDHASWTSSIAGAPALEFRARLALVLALILCTVLTAQRYTALKDAEDTPAMERSLIPGASWGWAAPAPRSLRLMTLVGALLGVGVLALMTRGPQLALLAHPAELVWFLVLIMLLTASFFRGLALTRTGANNTRDVIEHRLNIDLLRIDRLYPWGRAAARTSLVWFTVGAASCLLFVSDGFTLYAAALLLGLAAIGVWVFVATLSLVHRRIRRAKDEELDSVRTDIARLKTQLHDDPTAPPRLQSLLAYEARIAGVPEWPFDQTILVRLGASALILTVPWFGQAFAGLVVEQLGKH